MKKFTLILVTGSFLFASCVKDEFMPQPSQAAICKLQTANPSGKSYAKDSVAAYTCTEKHCGILPLSTGNYWVYQDSVFLDGQYLSVRLDTLRFSRTMQSPDGLVWWESNIQVGLPARLYANDSAFFKLEDRMFVQGIMDVKKDFSLFQGDSLRYLASFEDAAAMGRSLKIGETVKTPAGNFQDCLYFEKDARNYRKDRVIYKPGIGVLKYYQEKASMGSWMVQLQQVSTLLSYHIE